MLWIFIILATVVIDRISKLAVINNIGSADAITIIKNFFYIVHSENKGAAWGILQNGRYFFIIITAIILIVLAYFMRKYDNKLLKASIAFIIGGAMGNMIDRIFRGSVTDFLDFYIGSYHFPTFNAADSFVVIGTFLLAYYLLFIYKDNDDKKRDNEQHEEVRE